MVTASQLKSAALDGSNPLWIRHIASESASKSTGTKLTPDGTAIPATVSSERFQRWVAG